MFAFANKILYKQNFEFEKEMGTVQVSSLTPSDLNYERALKQISKIFPKEGQAKHRLGSLSPNNISVVLWVQIGNDRFLLGSDLECNNSESGNWTIIANDSFVIDGKANVFKVPHHGSASSHNSLIWEKRVSKNAYALITPYVNGEHRLPSNKDLNRISSFTNNVFVSSPPIRKKYKHPDKVVQKTLEETARKIFQENCRLGQIRLRKKINSIDEFDVALFGSAFKFSQT